MNNQILKAQNKKKKWLEMNDDSSDTDGSLTSDDEDEISEGIVGNIFDNTYLCIKYLGRGTFSRVWLVYNLKDNKYYAMKMQLPEFYDDAMYEIKILRMLGTEDSNIGKLYHVFSHKDNETDKYYYCLIIELLGESLLSLYDTFQDERIPLKVIKTIIKDVFMGLDECHSKNIIHTDLKPENILITKYPKHIDNIINWFNSLKPLETINLLIEKMLPDDYDDFNKNKKKNLKRKIRDKSYKIFSDIFLEKLDEYYTLEIDNEELNTTKMEVFPNPFHHLLSLNFKNRKAPDNFSFKIFDITGKTIIKGKSNTILTKINTENLETGLYFIKINFDDSLYVKRLIKE